MKKLVAISGLILVCAALSCEEPLLIRVAAATNLSGTLELLARSFESSYPGAKVEAVYASSGALAAQIRTEAPYDLFLSADVATPRKLEKEGFGEGEARVYAYGVLCVASRHGVDASGSLGFLSDGKYRSVALAQPELAPYGLAAKQALIASGLWESLAPRLVYGSNIGQVNQFVASASSDAGFVNLSAVLADPAYAAEGRPGIAWARVSTVLYESIAQAGLVVKRDDTSSGAARARLAGDFLDFLCSPEGRHTLEKAGYVGPP
jgi:molybdate transport system substrate-binding protein